MVERFTVNEVVLGSIPRPGAERNKVSRNTTFDLIKSVYLPTGYEECDFDKKWERCFLHQKSSSIIRISAMGYPNIDSIMIEGHGMSIRTNSDMFLKAVDKVLEWININSHD